MVRRPVTAQDSALRALRTDILTGQLKPGDQIVQETLAERYGVSRVPLREALKMLESEGQVAYYPHRGYFVAELSVDDLLELYRLRSLLESEAITHAVPAMSDEDVEAVAALLARVDSASDASDVLLLTEANRLFHFAIFEAGHQPRLTRLLHQLWDATEAYRALYFQESANRARVGQEHAAMLAALRRRDTARLIGLHQEHRDHSVAAVSSMLADPSPS
jgi:DNA-binding GntR family transcriptional regulator